jgi:hypothetical protein
MARLLVEALESETARMDRPVVPNTIVPVPMSCLPRSNSRKLIL